MVKSFGGCQAVYQEDGLWMDLRGARQIHATTVACLSTAMTGRR